MTTYTVFKEYIWLVNTIYRAKAISFAEINRRWVQTDMSGGTPFSRTTFHRHRIAIEEIFGVYIQCAKRDGNKYSISNKNVLREDSVQNWMLSTLTVSNMLGESQSLRDRILLENVPSGGDHLQMIINAMKKSRRIVIGYRRYANPAANSLSLEPYCVKLFRQRWYVLGKLQKGYLAIFSLDRILDIEQTDEKYKIPDDFDASEYFKESFGMLVDQTLPVERVVLRAYGYEPYYLRDLPLHHTQREINCTDEYTDFELRLKLTADFKSKLLSRGEWIEVLEPKSLADNLIEMHRNSIKRYEQKKIEKK